MAASAAVVLFMENPLFSTGIFRFHFHSRKEDPMRILHIGNNPLHIGNKRASVGAGKIKTPVGGRSWILKHPTKRFSIFGRGITGELTEIAQKVRGIVNADHLHNFVLGEQSISKHGAGHLHADLV